MRVFGTQDLAVDAACRFLEEGSDNRIEVGPMAGPHEGSVLNAHDLRRIYESRDVRVRSRSGDGRPRFDDPRLTPDR